MGILPRKPFVNKDSLELLPQELRTVPTGDIYQAMFYGNITESLRKILEHQIRIWDIPRELFDKTLEELASLDHIPEYRGQEND